MEEDKIKLVSMGKRVREVRKEKGLSGAELANLINCSQNNISKIERGVSGLNYDNLSRIAKVCGISEDYLFLRSDFKTHAEAVKDAVNKMQNDDAMWTAFIKHIALYAGYEFKEANREGISQTDVNAPYIKFKNQDAEEYLSMREVNDFIDDMERYADMRLKTLFERRGRE